MPGSQESLLKYYEVYVYAYQKKKKRPNCEIEICSNTYMYEIHLSGALASCFTPAVGLFSPFRLRGMQVGCVYTGRKFGAWPGSVARALGIQSRAGWQVIARSRSASPKLTRILESHIFKFFCRSLLRCCVSMSHRLSSSFVGGHHSTTEAALLALPFVAATDGASLSSCVCAEFPSSYHRT